MVVRITSDMHHGRRFWLRPGQKVDVGSAESAEKVFPRSGLLPNHFRMECGYNGCLLTALGGLTLCNGVPVGQTALADGDRIEAGQMQFDIEIDGAKTASEAADSVQRASASPITRTGKGQLDDEDGGVWRIVRASDKATLLQATPTGDNDPLARYRSMIAATDPAASIRVFQLMPPGALMSQDAADEDAAATRLFVAQHLRGEDQERLSVSLHQILDPLEQLPPDRQPGTVGWITRCDDEVIARVLGLAAQGRGGPLERPHPEWMLRSADPVELSQLLADCSDSFLDNLVDGFDLIWVQCGDPPQYFVLVKTDFSGFFHFEPQQSRR
ncbi:FHA domain-containing protein [Stieleria sp. ICT_E10.1]|uniref:FHA domain-containing protein n=1 Tax=Stieleria sedimenti TaxID=2976331 RepID=UPI00217FB4BB|nr:FHA domain-containing protein [Stieleria sedimenti]MCS7466702.1 FHA domain-containing protein [Stieleria sedimenti]